MIENFISYNPVTLYFGKACLKKLPPVLSKYGKKVLLVYGKGSIKKYGYYDKVVEELEDFQIFEYSGIKPNPTIEDVRKATELGKQENVDMVLAIGGGSVIDSAKVIAVSIAGTFDPWDFVKGKVQAEKTLPLIDVLTLAATGTEMNGAAVIQNVATNEKLGFFSPLMYPKHSFVDPSFQFSVSAEYTAYATADIIAHALEAYFGAGEPEVVDYTVFGIVKTAMKYGKLCMQEPNNYNYRANHSLAATLALNGITYFGKKGGDWGVHAIAHNFSMAFDTPHGATLSLTYPAWLRYHSNIIPERIIKLGKNLWNVETTELTIAKLEEFFRSVSCPIRLSDLNLTNEQIDQVRNLIKKNKPNGAHHQLDDEALNKIIEFMH